MAFKESTMVQYRITPLLLVAIMSRFCSFNFAEAKNSAGFSGHLIHRDSPDSPLYNPLESPEQRLANAVRRSINRANHIYASVAVSPNSPRSTVTTNDGEYIMKLSIGTPPFKIFAIADTGSDLIWTQCKPCSPTDCYKQDAPLFDPRSSKTYTDLPCRSKPCDYLPSHVCSRKGVCKYQYEYGSGFTSGNLATETLALDSATGRRPVVSFRKITIGCGRQNYGTFNKKESGIVGLGSGPLSLVRQLDFAIDGKFSYCLVPCTSHKNRSTLNFGSEAVLSGKGVVSTPMIQRKTGTFYYLILEAVSVDNQRIPFASSFGAPSGKEDQGNIIIDSGSTFTLVPETFFSKLAKAVDKVVDGQRIKKPPEDLADMLCYNTTDSKLIKIPEITAHFKGADLKLYPKTLFLEFEKGVTCFTFMPSVFSIFGNLAQSNFLVGYDLKRKTDNCHAISCSNSVVQYAWSIVGRPC